MRGPEQALAAAREALVRLPWLKSLNPLASDSQGSANLGRPWGLWHGALGTGLRRPVVLPALGGEPLFMANRYESDFSRSAELYQGYLADPWRLGPGNVRRPFC